MNNIDVIAYFVVLKSKKLGRCLCSVSIGIIDSNFVHPPSVQLDKLRAMLKDLPESPGVLRLDCEIPEYPSFFPGGRGYKGQSFPQSPIMFVGHNFDTSCGFYRSVERGAEDVKMPTWAKMKKYFLAGLDEEECFFTNFFLGAMIPPEPCAGEKKAKNTGTFKCSAEYGRRCIVALKRQVEIARPRVVALLGSNVPPAFAEAFPDYALFVGDTLAETQSKQPDSGHTLQLFENWVQIVCLYHPASRGRIESHRAQGSLLRSAVEQARLVALRERPATK